MVMIMSKQAKAQDRWASLRLDKEQQPACIYVQGVLAVKVGNAYIESYWLNLRYMQEVFSPTLGKGVIINFKGHDEIMIHDVTMNEAIAMLNACNHMEKKE
jgi:hypothetical protein